MSEGCYEYQTEATKERIGLKESNKRIKQTKKRTINAESTT
jgi:hypothetical protein